MPRPRRAGQLGALAPTHATGDHAVTIPTMNDTTHDRDDLDGGFDIESVPFLSRAREIDAAVRDFAREQPLLTAAIAMSIGYFCGRILRKL
jgi:hypothetical protein